MAPPASPESVWFELGSKVLLQPHVHPPVPEHTQGGMGGQAGTEAAKQGRAAMAAVPRATSYWH